MSDSHQFSAANMGIIVCPTCQHVNVPLSTCCAKCGGSLESHTTVIVPEKTLDTNLTSQLSDLSKIHGDGLVLYFIGSEQPVIFKGQGSFTLGRKAPGTPLPTCDLEPYNGQMLGVSRVHARIEVTDDQYTIEDLKSANGTFVNETRMTPFEKRPIRNGDFIRFGQLTSYVYVAPRQKAAPPD